MDEFISIPWVVPTLIGFAILGLLITFLMEQGQFLAKYSGYAQNKVAIGYNRAMKMMVGGRVGAFLFAMSISLVVESGYSARGVSIVVLSGVACLVVCQLASALVFRRQQKENIKANAPSRRAWAFAGISAVAGIFNLLGFTVPFILAAEFPDYRLTLSNTSVMFNTIFTLLKVFVVENELAKMIDKNSSQMPIFTYMLLVSRVVGSACVFLTIWLSL
ncbi:MAG: hypothetical protein AAGJ34_11305 [Pseudomonadota bacterium]